MWARCPRGKSPVVAIDSQTHGASDRVRTDNLTLPKGVLFHMSFGGRSCIGWDSNPQCQAFIPFPGVDPRSRQPPVVSPAYTASATNAWGVRWNLNPQPLGPHPSALTD